MRKGDERKASLLRAAKELFFSRGYAATSVNDILDTQHVSKGSFYHHFESKLEVLTELCKQHQLEAAERYRSAVKDDMSALEKLDLLLYHALPANPEETQMCALLLQLYRTPEGDQVISAVYVKVKDGYDIGRVNSQLTGHLRKVTAEDQADGTYGHAGDPPGVRGAAQYLGQHAAGPQQEGVQLAAAHHGREIAGDAPAKDLRNIEGDGHEAEKEVQVTGTPLVQPVKTIDDQDYRQHFPAFHHQLGQRLHQEGKGVLQLTSDQHNHGTAIQTKGVHALNLPE